MKAIFNRIMQQIVIAEENGKNQIMVEEMDQNTRNLLISDGYKIIDGHGMKMLKPYYRITW